MPQAPAEFYGPVPGSGGLWQLVIALQGRGMAAATAIVATARISGTPTKESTDWGDPLPSMGWGGPPPSMGWGVANSRHDRPSTWHEASGGSPSEDCHWIRNSNAHSPFRMWPLPQGDAGLLWPLAAELWKQLHKSMGQIPQGHMTTDLFVCYALVLGYWQDCLVSLSGSPPPGMLPPGP